MTSGNILRREWQARSLRLFLFFVYLCLVTFCPAVAEELTLLGGDLSSDLPGRHAIQAGAPNVTDPERIFAQASGFPLFHRRTTSAQGLGPFFNNNSCGGCHVNNGKGPATFSSSNTRGSSMVLKVKLPGLNADGTPKEVPGVGGQVLDHTTLPMRPPRIVLRWVNVKGRYNDGVQYELRRPSVRLNSGFSLRGGVVSSLRMSPALIGQGLLEAVSNETVVALSDPTDRDNDGISGRVNYVKEIGTSDVAVGRFGFKATQPSVKQQVGSAAYHDMGISNALFNNGRTRSELSLASLEKIAIYLRIAGVPKARDQSAAQVLAGQETFKELRCDACHQMTMTTSGVHPDPELRNQTIHPFTDLLLHDMGSGLADGWTEFSAKGREWRTAPLWGLGFSESLSRRKVVYLHDGRARSIEEAILWHGGEGTASREGFRALSAQRRDELITFLRSL